MKPEPVDTSAFRFVALDDATFPDSPTFGSFAPEGETDTISGDTTAADAIGGDGETGSPFGFADGTTGGGSVGESAPLAWNPFGNGTGGLFGAEDADGDGTGGSGTGGSGFGSSFAPEGTTLADAHDYADGNQIRSGVSTEIDHAAVITGTTTADGEAVREFVGYLNTLPPDQAETQIRQLFDAERPADYGTAFGILNEWARTPGGAAFGDGDVAQIRAKTDFAADLVTEMFAERALLVPDSGLSPGVSDEQHALSWQIPKEPLPLPRGESAYVLLGRINEATPELGKALPDSLALYYGSGAEELGLSQDQFFALDPAVQQNLGSFDPDNPLGVPVEEFVGFGRYEVSGLNAIDAGEAVTVRRDIIDEPDGGARVRAAVGLGVSEVGDVTGDIVRDILENPGQFLASFATEGAIGAIPVVGQVYELYETGREGVEVFKAIVDYKRSHDALQAATTPEERRDATLGMIGAGNVVTESVVSWLGTELAVNSGRLIRKGVASGGGDTEIGKVRDGDGDGVDPDASGSSAKAEDGTTDGTLAPDGDGSEVTEPDGRSETTPPGASPSASSIPLTPGQFELASTRGENRSHLTIEDGRVTVDVDSPDMTNTAKGAYGNLVSLYGVDAVAGFLHAYQDGGLANLPPALSAADVAELVVVHTNPDGGTPLVHDLQHAVTEQGVSEFEESFTHDTTTDAFVAYGSARGYDYFGNGGTLSAQELSVIESNLESDWNSIQGEMPRGGHANEFRSANAGNILDKAGTALKNLDEALTGDPDVDTDLVFGEMARLGQLTHMSEAELGEFKGLLHEDIATGELASLGGGSLPPSLAFVVDRHVDTYSELSYEEFRDLHLGGAALAMVVAHERPGGFSHDINHELLGRPVEQNEGFVGRYQDVKDYLDRNIGAGGSPTSDAGGFAPDPSPGSSNPFAANGFDSGFGSGSDVGDGGLFADVSNREFDYS